MIVSRTWSNAGLEGCTASAGWDTSTGCSGWSRLCDHAAAVPAVRRGSSCLRFSSSTEWTFQLHADLGTHSAHCAADHGDVTGTVLGMVVDAPVVVQRQVPWLGRAENCGVSAVAVLAGVVQLLDKVVVPAGATSVGRAMLGSTMDTCSCPGWLWQNFYDFLHEGVGSAPELNSRPARTSSTTAVACSLLVLLVLTHLALCSHDCRQSADRCFSCSRVDLEICTLFSTCSLYFSAFSTFEILRELIFWSPRALTGVSVRGLGVGADAGSSLSGVGPPVVHN